MWSEFNYISIREILSRILRHPLLEDTTLEEALQYTLDFIHAVGIPYIYTDKETTLKIENYRALLPCDLIAINQVYHEDSKKCIRSMTDTFINNNNDKGENTFKTQGTVIYTSFKEGTIKISYKAIPIDDEEIPMIPDNPIFLKALELYIKKERFTVLFDLGKININILQNTQQEYAFKVGQCISEFTIPSISEMESITRMFTTLVANTTHFDSGFKHLGNREYIRRH